MYVTPKGKDERLVKYPPDYTTPQVVTLVNMFIKFMNWGGFYFAVGRGMSTHFLDAIMARIKSMRSVVFTIVGPPGVGKSWFALRLAQLIDPKFDVDKQVCFTREHIMQIIARKIKLKKGQVVMLDEAHMSGGARTWNEAEQKEIVSQLAAIRARGLVIIIVILDESMLDKILREFVLTYEVHMDKIGVATAYRKGKRRFVTQQYPGRIGSIGLEIPGKETCPSPNCLDGCEYLGIDIPIDNPCMCMRAIYERNKDAFIMNRALKSSNKILDKMQSDYTDKELAVMVSENQDHIEITTTGKIKAESVGFILTHILQLNIKKTRRRDIAYLVGKLYPNILPPKKGKSP